MTLLLMPDEILARIFQNLPKDALAMSTCVCRRFHNVAAESLYRDIAFQAPSHYPKAMPRPTDVIKFYNLLQTLAAKPYLISHTKSLYLHAWYVMAFFQSSPSIFRMPPAFPSLTSLEFEYGWVTIQKLTDVLHQTPMLRCLYCKFIYRDDISFDLDSLGQALKLVGKTIEELALTLSVCNDNDSEDEYREYRLEGHLGSVLRDCLHLKRLTTQISVLLGVTHKTTLGLLDVLPLTLSQLRLADARNTVPGNEWFDPMLVDKLFDYLGGGAIKAGLKHLFVETQAYRGDFPEYRPGERLLHYYDEDQWVKLKRLVTSNEFDFSWDRDVVWINTLRDPCEQLLCDLRHP